MALRATLKSTRVEARWACPFTLSTSGRRRVGSTSFGRHRRGHTDLCAVDVSNDVTETEGMFMDANSFNQPLHAPWYHDEESDSE